MTTATRHDPRAVLSACYEDMDMCAWADDDETAFSEALDDEHISEGYHERHMREDEKEEEGSYRFDLNTASGLINARRYVYNLMSDSRFFWDDKKFFDDMPFDLIFEVHEHGITWLHEYEVIFRADQEHSAREIYSQVMREIHENKDE